MNSGNKSTTCQCLFCFSLKLSCVISQKVINKSKTSTTYCSYAFQNQPRLHWLPFKKTVKPLYISHPEAEWTITVEAILGRLPREWSVCISAQSGSQSRPLKRGDCNYYQKSLLTWNQPLAHKKYPCCILLVEIGTFIK